MNVKKHIVILMLLIGLAFALRVVKVWDIPSSLSWDEVSIGYNAYSILKTGKDEHGKFIPLDAFTAYGDYKPPLSIYITVPFVALFGLNEFSVRIPSVLFGTLTVLLTYFLVKELLYKTKNENSVISFVPILSATLFAISPWHINLSRAGFEATIALFFVVLGIYLIFLSMRKPKIWYGSFIPFVLAIYTFNSSRYFVPFLAIGIVCLYWKILKNQWKYIAVGCLISIMALLPIMPHLFSKEARLRFAEVNIFTDSSVVTISNKRIEESNNAWWAKIIYNRRIGYFRSFLIHYFDHFQPEYLFFKGDGNPKFSIQNVGQLYLIEAPFLVIGVFTLIRDFPTVGILLLYWLCMAIVPAAVARETPHALRTLNSLPTWQIFIAYGILQSVGKFLLDKPIWKKRFHPAKILMYFPAIIIFFCYVCSVSYYLFTYYVHYPRMYSGEWQYGYREAFRFVSPLEKNYDSIYVTETIGRPYMYALFYNKIDPQEFFRNKNASFDAAGFYHVYGFGKYRFVKDMPNECSGKCLFVGQSDGVMNNVNVLKTISLMNGNPVLTIYEK